MNASRFFRASALILMALLLTTCRDSTGGNDRPTAGWLALRLTTPNSDDGGVLIAVSGAAIDSIRSSLPVLITRRESGTSIRAVISGNVTSGVIAEIRVPDTRQSAQYAAVISEAASRGNYAQRNIAGYQLSVVAPAR